MRVQRDILGFVWFFFYLNDEKQTDNIWKRVKIRKPWKSHKCMMDSFSCIFHQTCSKRNVRCFWYVTNAASQFAQYLYHALWVCTLFVKKMYILWVCRKKKKKSTQVLGHTTTCTKRQRCCLVMHTATVNSLLHFSFSSFPIPCRTSTISFH